MPGVWTLHDIGATYYFFILTERLPSSCLHDTPPMHASTVGTRSSGWVAILFSRQNVYNIFGSLSAHGFVLLLCAKYMYLPTHQLSFNWYAKHPFACFGNSSISHTQMASSSAPGRLPQKMIRGGRLRCGRGVFRIFCFDRGRLLRILPVFAKNSAPGRVIR